MNALNDNLKWESHCAIAEGAKALPGTKCPYSKHGEIHQWGAWLAGHYDKHGKAAWEEARI
jgi:hypothetical protein